jgi:hypothetical protein
MAALLQDVGGHYVHEQPDDGERPVQRDPIERDQGLAAVVLAHRHHTELVRALA